MGILAIIDAPKIFGKNLTRKEWRDLVRGAIQAALQDEEKFGADCPFNWDEVRRQFPQLTLVEFVDACGRLSHQKTSTER
jgi:hypothetical protein